MARTICCLSVFLLLAVKFSNGIADIPYFYNPIPCSVMIEEDFGDFNSKRNQFGDKLSDVICLPLAPTKFVQKNIWKGYLRKLNDVSGLTSIPLMASKPHLGIRKRSVEDMNRFLEDNDRMNSVGILQPMLRLNRNRKNIKTVHLHSSFTPRLGRKRSEERMPNLDNAPKLQPSAISSRSRHIVNLNAGTAFTPRLGRAEELRAILKSKKGGNHLDSI